VSVDRNEVGRIARLAHLRFEGEAADRLTEEMSRILDYSSRLRDGNEGVSEGDRMHQTEADVPIAGRAGTRALGVDRPDPLSVPLHEIAPRHERGFFVVPPPPGVSPDARSDAPEDTLLGSTPRKD